MDRLAARVARRFTSDALPPTEEQQVASARTGLEKDEAPLDERVRACEADLRKCIDGGGHKWDAIFHALANMTQDPLHMDIVADGAALGGQETTEAVLRGLDRAMIFIDWTSSDDDVEMKAEEPE